MTTTETTDPKQSLESRNHSVSVHQTDRGLNIYQIFYDDVSRLQLDPDFIPLDNTANLRPDWAEYWVIRQYFLNHAVDDQQYYGFFSPKFTTKTGLTGSQVKSYLQTVHPDVDVVSFSPYWTDSAFFKSNLEQGEHFHAGFLAVMQKFFDMTQSPIVATDFVSHTQNTIWCNYFVAKPRFWSRWLVVMDALFQMAEDRQHPLCPLLNQITHYVNGNLPLKVFIVERLATVIIACEPYRIQCFDPFLLPTNKPKLDQHKTLLVACDALKQIYVQSRNPIYLNAFEDQRRVIPRDQVY